MKLHKKHMRIINALLGSTEGRSADFLAKAVSSQRRYLREPLEELFGCGYIAFCTDDEPWRNHQQVASLPDDPQYKLYYRLTTAARLALQQR